MTNYTTIKELAAETGYCRKTIQTLLHAGEGCMPSRSIGNTLLFPRKSALKHIAKHGVRGPYPKG